jgi:hypothetical protein
MLLTIRPRLRRNICGRCSTTGTMPSASTSKLTPYSFSASRNCTRLKFSMMSYEIGPTSRTSMSGRSSREARTLCCRSPTTTDPYASSTLRFVYLPMPAPMNTSPEVSNAPNHTRSHHCRSLVSTWSNVDTVW